MCKRNQCTYKVSSVLGNEWNTMCWEDMLCFNCVWVHTQVCVHVCVYLQSWVDGEAASCGVHAGHVLNTVYFLQKQLITVVPGSAHTHMHTHKQACKKKKIIILQPCMHTCLLTRTGLCWYGCLSSYLSWRGSAASSFLSISYLKSSQHISNGLTVSKPVSLCLTQWNHVQNGLTVSERWATKSF